MNDENLQKPPVLMNCWSVRKALAENLLIPQYQRAYIWRTATVDSFLSDISSWMMKPGKDNRQYHLGTIILREIEQDGCTGFEIVDGQQRLVTLSLLAYKLCVVKNNNLLDVPLYDTLTLSS